MQDPNADTEWNDVLRAKGILPPKQETEVTEDQLARMVEDTIQAKAQGKAIEDMTLEELEALEDEEDERMLLEYRHQRMAEMHAASLKAKYGSVIEITAHEYVKQVNEAGDGVWVVLHLYKQGIPLCALLNKHMDALAAKYPAVKFIRSISTTCIPNYPDHNLPTFFIYFEGDMKAQLVGPITFGGMNLKQDELEWMLSEKGVMKTDLEENPFKKRKIHDVMTASLKKHRDGDDSDDSDD